MLGSIFFVFLPGRPRRRKFPPAKFLNGIEGARAGAYTRLNNQILSALVGSNPVFERDCVDRRLLEMGIAPAS